MFSIYEWGGRLFHVLCLVDGSRVHFDEDDGNAVPMSRSRNVKKPAGD
jgi:hypothetical protein